jgi:hypothetical protein
MFNPYSAGKKYYGGGRSAPNIGPVDPMGYAERDRQAQVRRNAVLKRLQKMITGNYNHPDAKRWL